MVIDEGAREWDDYWGSIHEAAHAVVARHFGYPVPKLTMTYARIPHPRYDAPDDPDSIKRLLVSCAGNAATLAFLGYTKTGTQDDLMSLKRLRGLGAGFQLQRRLLRGARELAHELVLALRKEIYAVAKALRRDRKSVV